MSDECDSSKEFADFIQRARSTILLKIAEELCSVQPMNDITYDTLQKSFEWLEQSRISRGVHPLTEEPLDEE